MIVKAKLVDLANVLIIHVSLGGLKSHFSVKWQSQDAFLFVLYSDFKTYAVTGCHFDIMCNPIPAANR